MSCVTPSPKGLPQLALKLIVTRLQLFGMFHQSITSGESNGMKNGMFKNDAKFAAVQNQEYINEV